MESIVFSSMAITGVVLVSALVYYFCIYIFLHVWSVIHEWGKYKDDFVEYARERKRMERLEKELKKESGENDSKRV